VLEKPVEIVYRATSGETQGTSTPRVLIMLEDGAQITLIERFYGSGKTPYFQNMVQDVVLAPMARLTHYRLLQEQSQAFHLSNIVVHQKHDSYYKATSFDLSGALLRTNIEVDFQGQNAKCDLKGLYIVNDSQQTDMHTNILHHVPSCHSQQIYKGVLAGKGRAVFDGRIFVDKDAQYTDAQLSNNNLLLCEGAEVDTKPQLEIYADNVKCSHGTTVGQLEPEQLFYLRSRGIAEADAFRMLCHGFAAEILLDCDIEPLREYVDHAMHFALSSER
jgi:Fe-S cluster assembly protein SufD